MEWPRHTVERQDTSRLEPGDGRLVVLRPFRTSHSLHRSRHSHQDCRHGFHQRGRRLWRNIRPLPFRGRLRRFLLLPPLEHGDVWHLPARKELRALGHGGGDGGSDARPTDRHIPDSRNHGRLPALRAAAHRRRGQRDGDKHIRAPQHLRHAIGTRGETPHPPYRQEHTHADEHELGNREERDESETRHTPWQIGQRVV